MAHGETLDDYAILVVDSQRERMKQTRELLAGVGFIHVHGTTSGATAAQLQGILRHDLVVIALEDAVGEQSPLSHWRTLPPGFNPPLLVVGESQEDPRWFARILRQPHQRLLDARPAALVAAVTRVLTGQVARAGLSLAYVNPTAGPPPAPRQPALRLVTRDGRRVA